MTYSNHFVMCILVNGRPLKERADGIVQIPMNTEYAIRFRNKNSRRAMVNFTIDAENASGNGYIIETYSDLEIKRFADRDQMFKFVDLKSDEAQLDGKDGPNLDGVKGVIQANFYLERQPTYLPVYHPTHVKYGWPRPLPPFGGYECPAASPVWFNSTSNPVSQMYTNLTKNCVPCSTTDSSIKTMMEGVTVGGQSSGQTFTSAAFDAESYFVTLRVVLRGMNEPVEVTATQVDNEYCTKCGAKKARKNDAFCGKCGSRL